MKTKQRVHLTAIGMVLLSAFLVQILIRSPVRAQIILDVIDVGVDVGGIAVNPNTNLVYVAVTGQLNVYNAQTHAFVTTIPLPQNYTPCYDVALNLSTNRIYAAGLRTYVIDGNTNNVLGNFDKSGNEVAINPTTNRVYIAGMVNYPYSDPYVIHVLDGGNNSWLTDIQIASLASFESIHLAINPSTNRVYATFTGDDNLRVFDGNSHAELTSVHLENIGYVVVNPDTNKVYAGINYTDAVVLDGVTHTQVGMISRIGAGRLQLNRLTNRLYGIAATSPGYVLRIADSTTYELLGYIHLDGNLADYDLHPQLGKLFASHYMIPTTWGKKVTIIQDESPTAPAPTPKPPAVIATLDLPENVDGAAVNRVTNQLYIGMEGSIAVFNATSLAWLNSFDLTENPDWPPIYDIGINETQNLIYAVSVSGTYVVNGANNQVIGTLGSGNEIAVNSNNGRVYIFEQAVWLGDPDRLKIYDGVTTSHIRTIDLGTSIYFQSGHVAVNPGTGYAYCTYSLDDDLRIISPTTDDVAQTIDYTSIGDVTVNPTTNRVFVWISRQGKSGAVILDGNNHTELGMIQGVSGQLETNPQTNRLYGYTGYTLLEAYDVPSGELMSRIYLDGNIRGYTVSPGLLRVYAVHHDYPEEWSNKVSVIQDTAESPPIRIYLPLIMRE